MFEDSRGSKPSSIEALERKIKSARQNRTHLDAKALSSSAPKRQLTPQEQLAARKSTVPLTAVRSFGIVSVDAVSFSRF